MVKLIAEIAAIGFMSACMTGLTFAIPRFRNRAKISFVDTDEKSLGEQAKLHLDRIKQQKDEQYRQEQESKRGRELRKLRSEIQEAKSQFAGLVRKAILRSNREFRILRLRAEDVKRDYNGGYELTCPSYQELWDFIIAQGFKPYIESKSDKHYSFTYYLAARI